MNEKPLSTSQAAQLLQVHESTIKRWTESPSFPLEKTPGGHRRIELEPFLAWAKTKTKSPLFAFRPDEGRVAKAALEFWEGRKTTLLGELLRDWLDTHSSHALSHLFRYLCWDTRSHLPRLFDQVLGPLLTEVGKGWETGRVSVGREHLLTAKILDALYHMRADFNLRQPYRLGSHPKALVGCAEGALHELGAMFTRIVLETTGYAVVYLGPNVPFSEYGQLAERHNFDIICISFLPPLAAADAMRGIQILSAMYPSSGNGYRLVLGGGSLGHFQPPDVFPFLDLQHFNSQDRFQQWLDSVVNREIRQPFSVF